MEIGTKLKDARIKAGYTQEHVADKLNVSRQTISNWENEKCYPDIISIINLSNLYLLSLDELLKEDSKIIAYLDHSTNVVNSNKKLYYAFFFISALFLIIIIFNTFIENNPILLFLSLSLMIINTVILLHQILKKF